MRNVLEFWIQLHTHPEIEMLFKFIPKILMSKECIHFLGHSVYIYIYICIYIYTYIYVYMRCTSSHPRENKFKSRLHAVRNKKLRTKIFNPWHDHATYVN